MGLSFYFDAFNDLCTERQASDHPVSIAWSKIQLYAKHYSFNYDEAEKFHKIIRSMDNAYLEHIREKMKKDAKKSEQQSKSTRKHP